MNIAKFKKLRSALAEPDIVVVVVKHGETKTVYANAITVISRHHTRNKFVWMIV